MSVQYEGQNGMATVAAAVMSRQQLFMRRAVIFTDEPKIRLPANLSDMRPKISRPTTLEMPIAESNRAASFGLAFLSPTV